MFNRNTLILATSAIVALGLFSGCELEEDTVCTTNADCTVAGETCLNIDAETQEGTCGVEGTNPQTCGDDTQCSGNFACDTTAGTCATSCTADAGCADGSTCNADGTACVADVTTWPYVAIVSETTASNDINDTNTPGPDIDAIELVAGGSSFFATTVAASAQGAGGNGDGNVNSNISAITGANDAITTGGGDCVLDDDSDGAKFWSMGDTTGFVVVTFAQEPADGNTIKVWELDEQICDNVGTARADHYGVYLGNNSVVPGDILAATGIGGSNWLSLGSGTGNPSQTDVSSFAIATP